MNITKNPFRYKNEKGCDIAYILNGTTVYYSDKWLSKDEINNSVKVIIDNCMFENYIVISDKRNLPYEIEYFVAAPLIGYKNNFMSYGDKKFSRLIQQEITEKMRCAVLKIMNENNVDDIDVLLLDDQKCAKMEKKCLSLIKYDLALKYGLVMDKLSFKIPVKIEDKQSNQETSIDVESWLDYISN